MCIRDSHNTVSRFADFTRAVEEDVMKRASGVQEEIRFVLDREPDTHVICDALAKGCLLYTSLFVSGMIILTRKVVIEVWIRALRQEVN